MTSALQRSPSQVRRESRRFEALKAQRITLLSALEALLELSEHVPVFQLDGGNSSVLAVRRAGKFVAAVNRARAAAAEVRACRVVPLEDPK